MSGAPVSTEMGVTSGVARVSSGVGAESEVVTSRPVSNVASGAAVTSGALESATTASGVPESGE